MATLGERVDDWFSLSQPVTYWSLWAGLLRASPVLLVGVAAAGVIDPASVTAAVFAPVPYVFFVATLGYAVRQLYDRGIGVSVGLILLYTAALATTGTLQRVLAEATVLLAVIGLLTFLAGIVGFAAPSLHRGFETGSAMQSAEERADFYDESNPRRAGGRADRAPADERSREDDARDGTDTSFFDGSSVDRPSEEDDRP